jgi:hypothetical protein
MEEMKRTIVEAESISSVAIAQFAATTTDLLTIIGPEVVKYTKRKADIEDQIRQQYEKQQQLFTRVARIKGRSLLELFRQSLLLDYEWKDVHTLTLHLRSLSKAQFSIRRPTVQKRRLI